MDKKNKCEKGREEKCYYLLEIESHVLRTKLLQTI